MTTVEKKLAATEKELFAANKEIERLKDEISTIWQHRVSALEASLETERERAEEKYREFQFVVNGTGEPPVGYSEEDRGVVGPEQRRAMGQYKPADAHVIYADRVLKNMKKRLNDERKKLGLKEVG